MANTRKPKAKPSLFEQARNAKPRTTRYDIPLVEYEETERRWTALNDARQALRRAEGFASATERAALQSAVDEAQASLDECYRRVTFHGLPPKDLDVLASEHPDPEGEEPEGHVGLVYHLAVACSDDQTVTADQWRDLCEEVWPLAEGQAFRQAVLDANYQPFSAGIPKG